MERVLAVGDASVGRGMAFAAASYAAFSTADALIKFAGGQFSSFQVAVTVALFALLPVLALAAGQGGPRALLPRRPALVLLRAVLTAACGLAVWYALTLLPIADVYALLFTAPMLATALSALLLGEQVGWRRWGATVVGFLAILLMVRPGFRELGFGHLLAAGGALTSAASIVVLRRIGNGETSAAILFAVFAAILLAALPGAAVAFRPPTPAELAPMALAGLLLGGGQAMLVLATRNAPAGIVAAFQYTQMIWGVAFGVLVFADLPDRWTLAGLALLIASGLYIVHRETVRSRPVTFVPVRGEVPARAARRARD